MRTAIWFFKISRPRFWFYLIGPFLLGIAAGYEGLKDESFIDFLPLILAGVFFSFPANLLIYGVNDFFDYETDKYNPKKKDYESLMEPKNRRFFAYVLAAVCIPFVTLITLLLIANNSSLSLLSLGLFLFFGVFYSAPPIRAKTKPFLDAFFNILYVFPGLVSYCLITNVWPPALVLLPATLWVMAMHAFSAVPDIKSDKKAGINTIATRLGRNNTLYFCALCYLFSAAIMYQYIGVVGTIGGVIYTSLMILAFRSRSGKELFSVYSVFPYVNVIFGFILFWHVLLKNA